MITDNEELKSKLIELKDRIVNMCNQFYKRRPSCVELLEQYTKWSIQWNGVILSVGFQEHLDQVKNSSHTFFNNYLTKKLNQ